MRPQITFFVAGVPKPAGSKRGFYIAKLKRVVITDANPNSADWKTDVKHTAQENFDGELWDCPIDLRLKFVILRPRSHYRTGKNAHLLRESAPKRPTAKPDALKLARGVEDALTKIIWVDDSQIVDEHLSKVFGERPGVEIEIKECE
jgi:Holliday junction resolvase RusA-like endonuclease